MAASFDDARNIIGGAASERAERSAHDEDLRPLDSAVGRIVKEYIDSPISTPTFDSVAINGYAVIASQVSRATAERPMRLRCMGMMKAGDQPLEVDDRVVDGMVCCIETTVGAAFPTAKSTGRPFDSIVPREHAEVIQEGGSGKILQIIRLPLTSWHKRITGSDFRKGDRILDRGMAIAPKYAMALASVGVRQVSVTRQVRVGVVSIGGELQSTVINQQALRYKIPDATGPFLTAAVREMGEDAEYLGVLPDDANVLTAFIHDKLENNQFDVFVTTGGINKSTPCSVETTICNLGGKIHLQNVAMQPGGSLLFASLPEPISAHTQQSPPSFYGSDPTTPNVWSPQTAAKNISVQPVIFALPGSPIASVCCFRFLVTPYIRALIGMQAESAILARVASTQTATAYSRLYDRPSTTTTSNETIVDGSMDYDTFRHAILKSQHDGVSVEVAKERSPAKASPFASSNCWMHVPRGHMSVGDGDSTNIYPFCSPKS
ncbi:hypothetical protein B0A55_07069 [Friedmanniomyces simplex]|uniref:molybdopterin adenylyltransferase n=1 Tax=Friedmanniomyces simplex TaxID=329884 RepID=A0A4U0X8D4_9PEZI|nr:hypothetical protein B0A55_07069 [Friedmanniomyces simplex]